MAETIFSKIIAGEIPADKLYEDDQCIAINDISPQAPVHVLVIPKKPLTSLAASEDQDQLLLGHLLLVVKRLAEQLGVSDGYRVIINSGEKGGQTVFHLHVHLLAGWAMPESGLVE